MYRPEWIATPIVLGAVLILVIVPPFAMIGLVVVALAALATLVALAGALLASPYLLVRSLRRHFAERRRPSEASGPVARFIAEAGMATRQPCVAALANPLTSTGRSRRRTGRTSGPPSPQIATFRAELSGPEVAEEMATDDRLRNGLHRRARHSGRADDLGIPLLPAATAPLGAPRPPMSGP